MIVTDTTDWARIDRETRPGQWGDPALFTYRIGKPVKCADIWCDKIVAADPRGDYAYCNEHGNRIRKADARELRRIANRYHAHYPAPADWGERDDSCELWNGGLCADGCECYCECGCAFPGGYCGCPCGCRQGADGCQALTRDEYAAQHERLTRIIKPEPAPAPEYNWRRITRKLAQSQRRRANR